MTISSFVDDLCTYESENVFNPYSDVCPIHDRKDAPQIRMKNIRRMVESAVDARARTIWIARDLGYRGGRRTGLPLTDEAHLDEMSLLMSSEGFRRATKGEPVAERTATVVWGTLMRIGEPIMLWNVFPFHPYADGDPMSNRCHIRKEREETLPFLNILIDLIRPEKLIAIGRDAALALEGISIQVDHVRHPSYGGQNEFIQRIEYIYDLKPRRL